MWIDINEQRPEECRVIDVWQAWARPSTGEKGGKRLTNAWVHEGQVLHGEDGMRVMYFTHWMYPPEAPYEAILQINPIQRPSGE